MAARLTPVPAPVLLHYHYLTEPACQPALREVMRRVGCSGEACAFVDDRLPRFRTAAVSTR